MSFQTPPNEKKLFPFQKNSPGLKYGNSNSSSASKQRQSSLKSIVKNFGELILSWKSHSDQASSSVQGIESLIKTLQSVRKTCYTPSYIQFRLLGMHKDISGEQCIFPDLGSMLSAKILADIETCFCHVKENMIALGDIIAAMKLKSIETCKVIDGQSLDILTSDEGNFNSSHVVEIVDIKNMLSCEYERKKSIISSTSEVMENSLKIAGSYDYNKLLTAFADDSPDSLVDAQRVEKFLIQNSIA